MAARQHVVGMADLRSYVADRARGDGAGDLEVGGEAHGADSAGWIGAITAGATFAISRHRERQAGDIGWSPGESGRWIAGTASCGRRDIGVPRSRPSRVVAPEVPRAFASPRRSHRRVVAVRQGRRPDRPRRDAAPAAPGRRPGPTGARRDVFRQAHAQHRRRTHRARLARPEQSWTGRSPSPTTACVARAPGLTPTRPRPT